MSFKSKYPKDDTKPYRYDFENLKVGDYVFSDSNRGFCSGGIKYGVGYLVTEITESEIVTVDGSSKEDKWCRASKFCKEPLSSVYFLGAFQSQNDFF